jgi:phage shock protein PspC (stress-responsive transcriptional regulator)
VPAFGEPPAAGAGDDTAERDVPPAGEATSGGAPDDAPAGDWPGHVPPAGDEPPAWTGEVGAGRTGAGRGGWSPPGGPERPAYGWDPRVPAPPPRRLARSSSDRVLGGVAGGLGRYFGLDPLIFRLAFVLLVFAGGAGVAVYALGWLFIPDEDGRAAVGRSRWMTAVGAIVLACAVLSLVGDPPFLGSGFGLLPFALLAVVGVALYRASRGEEGTGRVLARVGLALVLIGVAGAGSVAAFLGAGVGAGALIASAVIALGAALVVSAFHGGARWLVVPALALAFPAGLVAAADVDLTGPWGEREYRLASVSELKPRYEVGAGEVRIDMRDVDLPAGTTDVAFDVGMGYVELLVPPDACVASDIDIGVGYAGTLGHEHGGFGVDVDERPVPPSGAKTLRIAADVGLGAIEVARSPEELHVGDRDRWRERNRGPITAADVACPGAPS